MGWFGGWIFSVVNKSFWLIFELMVNRFVEFLYYFFEMVFVIVVLLVIFVLI